MRSLIIAALILTLTSGCSSGPFVQGTVVGNVVEIIDGDTIDVVHDKVRTRVKLRGIDAPEIGQAFGLEAKEHLGRLLAKSGNVVIVHIFGKDEQGQTLAVVNTLVGDEAAEINQEMILNGYAWSWKGGNDAPYAADEHDARSKKRGLWSETNSIPPWEWRER